MSSTDLNQIGHEESLRILQDGTVLDRVALESNALYFQGSDWILSWFEVFEPSARFSTWFMGDRQQPSALLMMARLRRQVHHRVPLSIPYVGLAGAGIGAADLVGPVGLDAAARDRVTQWALDRLGRQAVSFESVSAEFAATLVDRFGGTIVARRICPGLDLTSENELPSKVRKNLRRRERLMGEAGVVPRWITDSAELREGLEVLRRLHLQRWALKGGGGLFDERRMAFLQSVADRSRPDRGMRILLLENEEGPAGALLGFEFGATFCSYKTGWGEGFSQLSPGLMMHKLAIDRAREAGCVRYEFLRGEEHHKTVLGGSRDEVVNVVLPRGLSGVALRARDLLQERQTQRMSER